MAHDLIQRMNAALSVYANTVDHMAEPAKLSCLDKNTIGAFNAASELIRNFIAGEVFEDDEPDDCYSLTGSEVGVVVGRDLRERGIQTHVESFIDLNMANPPRGAAARYIVDIYNEDFDEAASE